jgi:hypothetical protein
LAYFTEEGLNLERLNLYVGKKKVLKLRTFLVLLVISVIPALSFFFFAAQWKLMKVNRLVESYPVVFNNLSEIKLNTIENQLETLNLTFQKKANDLSSINQSMKNLIVNSYTSSYFIKYISKMASEIPNKIYLSNAYFDGKRLYMEFYEYGTETRVSTSTVQSDLSKVYSNVVVNFVEERNFIGNTKYFHYTVEGTK